MTQFFLVYAMGRSGGSWMEAVFNFHPDVRAWEEPRRKLGLVESEDYLAFLKHYAGVSTYPVVGLLKASQPCVTAYMIKHHFPVICQYRNPIKVVHGKRRRRIKAERWWGRTDLTEDEIFEGILCKTAERFRAWQSHAWPLVRIEDLDRSLDAGGRYFKQVMEYVTRVEWNDDLVAQIQSGAVPPAGRRDASKLGMWQDDYEAVGQCRAPWEKRQDPPAWAIWEHWEEWQQEIFVREFREIMITGGYRIPE